MANSPAFSIRNYIMNSNNDEVIELDNEPMTVRHDYTKFRSNGRGKVSPAPSSYNNDNVVTRGRQTTTEWKPRRRRFQNVLLTLTSLLSLISFLLIVATLLGVVQPRTMRNSKSCQCVSPPASVSAGSDALKSSENVELRTEMAKIKQNMEAQFEKINARRDDDIEKLNEKFDDLKTRLSNFTTGVSYTSKKHGLFKQNLDNNLTQISAKMEKLAFNITKLTLFQKKAQENFRKTSTNYSNLLIYLQKGQNDTERRIFTVETKGNVQFDQLKKEMETNETKVLKKLDKLSLDIKKFVNDTSKEILRTSNINNMKFEQFQSKTERNLTVVSQSIDNLAENLQKLDKNTNMKFVNNLNHINKFDQLKKEMETNETKVLKKLDKLSLDIKKFVNDTSKEILRTSNINNMKFEQFQSKTERNLTVVSQSIDNLAENLQKLDKNTNIKFVNNLNHINKFEQLQKETETNTTKVLKTLDKLSLDIKKFVNDTSKEILRTSNINNMKFQRFQSKNERNLTIVSQSIQNLAEDLQKLDNDTNMKFVNNLSYINKLFVPSKLRGPRGYNGTRGNTGLPGPAGPRGPPTRIDFKNCQYSSASSKATTVERKTKTIAKDTQSQIVIPVSCESSIQGGYVKLYPAKVIPTGFQYDCMCKNANTRVDFTCTINYVLCNLN